MASKSVLTKYEQVCAFCGATVPSKHHLIFGTAERKKADEDGLWLPVCDACHNMGKLSANPRRGQGTMIIHGNSMAEAMSKMIGQLAWEKEYYRNEYLDAKSKIAETEPDEDPARDRFMSRYGRSYL